MGLLFPLIITLWILIILLYFLIVLIEAIRYSSRILETPHTLIAILLGNLTPGIGSFLAFLRLPIDIKKIYRNNRKTTR